MQLSINADFGAVKSSGGGAPDRRRIRVQGGERYFQAYLIFPANVRKWDLSAVPFLLVLLIKFDSNRHLFSASLAAMPAESAC